ncbi:MAG TPA: hypothetical protein VFT19_07455 [Solirubrobacterales bacterium]|nr:hypothetical protein [Solirubrobacterales bacterium]
MAEELRDLAVVEASVLEHLAELHPDRLTTDELELSLGSRCGRIAFDDALAGLRCSGLIRHNGDLVELTHAAVNAHELLR